MCDGVLELAHVGPDGFLWGNKGVAIQHIALKQASLNGPSSTILVSGGIAVNNYA